MIAKKRKQRIQRTKNVLRSWPIQGVTDSGIWINGTFVSVGQKLKPLNVMLAKVDTNNNKVMYALENGKIYHKTY